MGFAMIKMLLLATCVLGVQCALAPSAPTISRFPIPPMFASAPFGALLFFVFLWCVASLCCTLVVSEGAPRAPRKYAWVSNARRRRLLAAEASSDVPPLAPISGVVSTVTEVEIVSKVRERCESGVFVRRQPNAEAGRRLVAFRRVLGLKLVGPKLIGDKDFEDRIRREANETVVKRQAKLDERDAMLKVRLAPPPPRVWHMTLPEDLVEDLAVPSLSELLASFSPADFVLPVSAVRERCESGVLVRRVADASAGKVLEKKRLKLKKHDVGPHVINKFYDNWARAITRRELAITIKKREDREKPKAKRVWISYVPEEVEDLSIATPLSRVQCESGVLVARVPNPAAGEVLEARREELDNCKVGPEMIANKFYQAIVRVETKRRVMAIMKKKTDGRKLLSKRVWVSTVPEEEIDLSIPESAARARCESGVLVRRVRDPAAADVLEEKREELGISEVGPHILSNKLYLNMVRNRTKKTVANDLKDKENRLKPKRSQRVWTSITADSLPAVESVEQSPVFRPKRWVSSRVSSRSTNARMKRLLAAQPVKLDLKRVYPHVFDEY